MPTCFIWPVVLLLTLCIIQKICQCNFLFQFNGASVCRARSHTHTMRFMLPPNMMKTETKPMPIIGQSSRDHNIEKHTRPEEKQKKNQRLKIVFGISFRSITAEIPTRKLLIISNNLALFALSRFYAVAELHICRRVDARRIMNND